jgi:hypothetical protein
MAEQLRRHARRHRAWAVKHRKDVTMAPAETYSSLETPVRLSRRTLLGRTSAAAGAALLASGSLGLADGAVAASPQSRLPTGNAELTPVDPIPAIFSALERYPLVALCERHMLQEMHDFISALLFHPDLPATLTDIVVEFGCSGYQDVADRFLLTDQPVARADLVQIWRQVGDPAWNAPVYEQFFRTVRAVNWIRRPAHRLRVLLGQPATGMDQALAHPRDRALVNGFISSSPVDTHLAAVVDREALARGRRALLIAGGGHLLRGLYDEDGAPHLNAATQLVQRHPGSLFVVDLQVLPAGPQQDEAGERLRTTLAGWPRPSLALLRGTWLGALVQSLDGAWINWGAQRATGPATAAYQAQADALLYLGPGEILSASQADPAIYYWGTYAQHLRRLDTLESQVLGQKVDQAGAGIRWATGKPGWLTLWGS